MPMNIVLVTFGSRGDVQPMMALALALQSRGHRVLLTGPPEQKAWARELGCAYRPAGAQFMDFLDGMGRAHSPGSALAFIGFLRQELKAQFRLLPEAVQGADLAVGASLALALSSVTEALGIPYRYVAFTPQLLPSGRHPFFAVRSQSLPPWINRMTWTAARQLDRINLTRMLNRARRDMGLKRVSDFWGHVLGPQVLVACDAAIAGVPPDVSVPFVQTGYLHLKQAEVRDQALEAFLMQKGPVVYAGFGSMPSEDQARNVSLIAGAARDAGARAVIAHHGEGPLGAGPSHRHFFVHNYPHSHLFPRMTAVIHHGGAGTTATAARSGVPQIIVPHVLDQYYWGNRVFLAGLGPRPIHRARLSRKGLARAIEQCLLSAPIQQQAKSAAQSIRPEQSLEKACLALLGA